MTGTCQSNHVPGEPYARAGVPNGSGSVSLCSLRVWRRVLICRHALVVPLPDVPSGVIFAELAVTGGVIEVGGDSAAFDSLRTHYVGNAFGEERRR